MLTPGYLTVTVLLRVELFLAASVPLTERITFTLPLTRALLRMRSCFLLSLSVTLMVLPALMRFEAFLTTTTFFFLPVPLRILAVIFSDAASLDLTLKTSFLVLSAFWIFLAVIVSFGAVLSVEGELATSSSAMLSTADA